MNPDFLGKGAAFPLQVNPRGRIKKSTHEQKIQDSIRIILGTAHGERLMRPNFGCNLQSLVFASNSPATANLARHYVEEALTIWEPRITLEEVIVANDHTNARLLIQIRYTIKLTYEPRNFVYPFYLEQS